MTEKLYLMDSYLCEQDVQVIETGMVENKPGVVLDRTIFYPTSGGQMHDTGWLNDISILDVQIIDDKIWHVLTEPVQADRAHAVLNWQRRFDFMQQHTGFHILAGSFLSLLNIETLSSHLGEELSTIDINTDEIAPNEIDKVEEMANRIIWQDRLVHPFFTDEEEIKRLAVRKAPVVSGKIRLVDIEDFDLDPCGGTHVSSTGQVGLVKIIGRERIRKNLRFIFVAGGRALKLFKQFHQTYEELGNLLTTGIDGISDAVTHLKTNEKELRKKIRDQEKIIAEFHVTALCERAKKETIVDYIFSDMDLETLRWIASSAMKQQDGLYLLAGTGERASMVFACAGVELDLRPVFKQAMEIIEGKGGGEADFVQGSGQKLDGLSKALELAKNSLVKIA